MRGGGKSGGYRTIIVFKVGHSCFFVHGFAKSDKANISQPELKALSRLARVLLGFDAAQLASAIELGELIEVEENGG